MYISLVITGIIMILLLLTLVVLHWLSSMFPALSQPLSTIEMIILISILILVHEAGHFFVAELFKMKVTKFAFGLPIGPTLWKRKFGDVEVLIHAFLFGGYVAFPDDDKDLNLPPDSPDRFMNRPIYQRFFVLSAGVVSNLIFAFLFVALTAAIWGQMPSGNYNVYVKDIVAEKSASIWESGLQKGDKIISVNGTEVTNPNAISMHAKLGKLNDGKVDRSFVVRRYDELKAINPVYERNETILKDMVIKIPDYVSEPQIELNKDIIIGLEIYKDNREELTQKQKELRDKIGNTKRFIITEDYTLNDIAYAISDNVPAINLVVERNGEKVQLKPIYPNKEGVIGISMDIKEIPIKINGPISVITTSTKYLWNQTKLFGYSWYQLFTGKLPMSSLHGIIAVAKVGGDIIHSSGLFSGLLLTAIISLYLAIFNFLPIPALDGGHVMFLIIEKIRGKKIDEEVMEKFVTVFFIILIALIIVVCGNDIYALVNKQL